MAAFSLADSFDAFRAANLEAEMQLGPREYLLHTLRFGHFSGWGRDLRGENATVHALFDANKKMFWITS